MEFVASELCITLGIEGGEPSVCRGTVSLMANQLLPAIAEGILSPDRVCDEYLHICNQPHIIEEDIDSYVHNLLSQKPSYIQNNTFIDDLYRKIESDPNPRETVRAIQLSDIHIDFQYQEGAPNECNYPICCRDNGPSGNNNPFDGYKYADAKPAGKWGDFKCDIPHMTMKNMFDFIAENQDQLKTDFITWTGDNSAHNIWDNTQEEITQYTMNITNTLKESLGADSKIEIYPIQGNHDTWPVNV